MHPLLRRRRRPTAPKPEPERLPRFITATQQACPGYGVTCGNTLSDDMDLCVTCTVS
jgi:hypothetical protein